MAGQVRSGARSWPSSDTQLGGKQWGLGLLRTLPGSGSRGLAAQEAVPAATAWPALPPENRAGTRQQAQGQGRRQGSPAEGASLNDPDPCSCTTTRPAQARAVSAQRATQSAVSAAQQGRPELCGLHGCVQSCAYSWLPRRWGEAEAATHGREPGIAPRRGLGKAAVVCTAAARAQPMWTPQQVERNPQGASV